MGTRAVACTVADNDLCIPPASRERFPQVSQSQHPFSSSTHSSIHSMIAMQHSSPFDALQVGSIVVRAPSTSQPGAGRILSSLG